MKAEHLTQNGHSIELGKLSLLRRVARFLTGHSVSVAPASESPQRLSIAVRNSYPIGSYASTVLERQDAQERDYTTQRNLKLGLIGTVEYERQVDGSRVQVGVPTNSHLEALRDLSVRQELRNLGFGPQESSGEYMVDTDYVYGVGQHPAEVLPHGPDQVPSTPDLMGVPPHLRK